jgi:isopenicillin N synthase-like dioxygenase
MLRIVDYVIRVDQEPAVAADFKSIPVIDIAGLGSADLADRRRVAEALGAAAREVGFLYVTGHGVADDLSLGVREAARRFFAQDPAQKMAAYIGRSANHSGYVPEGEEVFESGKIDKKESFDVNLDIPEAAGEAPTSGLSSTASGRRWRPTMRRWRCLRGGCSAALRWRWTCRRTISSRI